MGNYVQNVLQEGIMIFDDKKQVAELNSFASDTLGIKKGMTLENIRNHLQKLRERITDMKKEEKKWMDMERQSEDAAKLKIIRKSNLTIEQLQYLNGINEEEIELIKRKRKEAERQNAAVEKPETSEKS